MIALFAEKIVTFEPCQFQKGYSLSFIMCCVRNFSAIFGVDPIRSSRDRASAVEGLPDGVLIMMWYCGERYFVPLGKVSWCRVGGLLIFNCVAGR